MKTQRDVERESEHVVIVAIAREMKFESEQKMCSTMNYKTRGDCRDR